MIDVKRVVWVIGVATLAVACAPSGDDGSAGSVEQASSRGATACVEGELRTTEDGCNTCTCSGGSWFCTELACGEPGGHVDDWQGDDWLHDEVSNEPEPSCNEGEVVHAEDGCNTCSCVDGAWACTELWCE